MKKTTRTDQAGNPEEMPAEYHFDDQKARPNRFAGRPRDAVIVMLDADVAEVFTTPDSVNNILRALITTMPHSAGKPTTR